MASSILSVERQVLDFVRSEWNFFNSAESEEQFAREFVLKCPGAQLTDLRLMFDFVKREYSSFDSARQTSEYALEYLALMWKWRHPYADFQEAYDFAKSNLDWFGNMRKLEWVLHEYIDQSAQGWSDARLLREAFLFHKTELQGMLQGSRDSADWALRIVRANRKSRLGFEEFRLIYDFAIENFSSLKSKETHAAWAVEIFGWGVPYDEIMLNYKGGGLFGLGKKEEITRIAEDLGACRMPVMRPQVPVMMPVTTEISTTRVTTTTVAGQPSSMVQPGLIPSQIQQPGNMYPQQQTPGMNPCIQPGTYPQQPNMVPSMQPRTYPQQPNMVPSMQPGTYPQQPNMVPSMQPGTYPQQPNMVPSMQPAMAPGMQPAANPEMAAQAMMIPVCTPGGTPYAQNPAALGGM